MLWRVVMSLAEAWEGGLTRCEGELEERALMELWWGLEGPEGSRKGRLSRWALEGRRRERKASPGS